MNAKEHEKKSAAYHAHLAKRESDKADAWGELGDQFRELGNHGVAATCRKQQDIHRATSDLESERSNYHNQTAMVSDMERDQPYTRGLADRDLDKLVPTDVRVVIPGAVSAVERIYGDTLTAVPRSCQPPIPVRPNIDPEFIKILGDPSGQDEERPL